MNPIPGWFPQGNRDLLERLIAAHGIRTVIEIGSFVGKSTVWLAERVGHVTAVDDFNAINSCNYLGPGTREAAQDQWGSFQRNTAGFPNITALRMSSAAAAQYQGGELYADLIYLDAAHDYDSISADITMWYPRATKVLCGDDYTARWPGVMRAVDELAAIFPVNREQRLWYTVKAQ